MKCYFSRNLPAGGCQPAEGGEEKASQTGGIVTGPTGCAEQWEQGAFTTETEGQRLQHGRVGEGCRCTLGLGRG